jgi:hypothetical protein
MPVPIQLILAFCAKLEDEISEGPLWGKSHCFLKGIYLNPVFSNEYRGLLWKNIFRK